MATLSVQFGSADLSNYFSSVTETIVNRHSQISVPQRDGFIVENPTIGTKFINFVGTIYGTDHENARNLVNSLTGELLGKGEDKLRIYDDKYINCRVQDLRTTIRGRDGQTAVQINAMFRADRIPFWESDTGVNTTQPANSGDYFNYVNSGTAPTPAKFTVVNCAGAYLPLVKFVVGSLSCSYSGSLGAGSTLVVDSRSFTVTNCGIVDYGNFAGSYLKLSTGTNSIQYQGSGPISFNIQYNDRWYNY